MGRLPSRKVQLELLPERGGGSLSDLQGELSKPWQVGLARHNDGQRKHTGEQQWDVLFLWDSQLGLGDQLRLRGRR